MKKFLVPLFSCLVVFTLIGSFGTVSAADLDDPVVTPVTGDMEFSTEIVAISSLPGITELPGGMLVPIGFPAGEAQFQGNAVHVTKFETGKANACFSITGTEQGWGGKVGVWNGEKWVLLATTITSLEESIVSSACASITGNGTYAFIRWVAAPELLTGCTYDTSPWALYTWPDADYLRFYVGSMDNVPDGTPVSYRILGMDPAGGLTGALSGEGFVGNYESGDADFIGYTVYFYDQVNVTVLIIVGNCQKVIQVHLNPSA